MSQQRKIHPLDVLKKRADIILGMPTNGNMKMVFISIAMNDALHPNKAMEAARKYAQSQLAAKPAEMHAAGVRALSAIRVDYEEDFFRLIHT